MRWRELILAGALVAGGAGGVAALDLSEVIDARLQVARSTETVLGEKHELRQRLLRTRVRSAYKLLRAGDVPLWVDADARAQLAVRRAAARRILGRDAAELALLEDELGRARAARERLERARDRAEPMAPEAGSLAPPVPGKVVQRFGRYRHRESRATLSRRGIELAARAGEPVKAPAPGRIRFAGPARGLGEVVIAELAGGSIAVLGRLDRLTVARGDRIDSGQTIGVAAGSTVYLEVRLDAGGAGHPIDPEPLLER